MTRAYSARCLGNCYSNHFRRSPVRPIFSVNHHRLPPHLHPSQTLQDGCPSTHAAPSLTSLLACCALSDVSLAASPSQHRHNSNELTAVWQLPRLPLLWMTCALTFASFDAQEHLSALAMSTIHEEGGGSISSCSARLSSPPCLRRMLPSACPLVVVTTALCCGWNELYVDALTYQCLFARVFIRQTNGPNYAHYKEATNPAHYQPLRPMLPMFAHLLP